MEIEACPKCGSRNIFQGKLGEGVLTGYTSKNVCQDCGYQGMPIIFDSEEEYNNFLKSKSIKRIPKKKLTIEKKQLVKNKRPLGVSIVTFFMFFEAIFSLFLYYSLQGSFISIWLWMYYIIIFFISALVLPYGLIKGKSWAWTIGSSLFALSIPIGLIFLYYLTRPHVKTYFGKS